MRTLRGLWLGLGLLLEVAACRSSTEPGIKPLAITTDDVGLTLRNPNPWPVFYRIMNPFTTVQAGYFPFCTDPQANCPRVPPGASISVPYSAALGFDPGMTEVAVTQWLLERQKDGSYAPLKLQSFTVVIPRTS
jgi:hypothetical protein